MYNMQDKLPVRLDSAEMEIVIAAIGQNIEKLKVPLFMDQTISSNKTDCHFLLK